MTVLNEVYRPGVVLRCDRVLQHIITTLLRWFRQEAVWKPAGKVWRGGGEAGQTPVSTQRAHGRAEYTQRRHNYWRELPAHLLTHWAEVERWRTRRRLLIRSLQETSVSQILTGMWSPASLCSAEKRKTFLLNQQTFTSENSRYWKWYHSIWSVEPAVLMK